MTYYLITAEDKPNIGVLRMGDDIKERLHHALEYYFDEDVTILSLDHISGQCEGKALCKVDRMGVECTIIINLSKTYIY